MGVGNLDLADDGFGVRLAETLQARGFPDVVVAGNTPERWIGRVAEERFHGLLFLDAVDFGAAPGSLLLMDTDEIAERFPQISTHKISLGWLARFAESQGAMQVWLLGAQPETLNPDGGLTSTLRTTLDAVCELLIEVMTGKHEVVVT
ncbi:MAG: hydrogenase maturation protease, partial [Terriglobales bacterium]|jgi:hydrogenase maturation protease